MSDVKKFTGFIAADGSTHTSMKAAIEHSREFKVRNALAAGFGGLSVVEDNDESDSSGVDLATFIYDRRDAILAALNQDVATRKKRGPNKKKEAAPEAAAQAVA